MPGNVLFVSNVNVSDGIGVILDHFDTGKQTLGSNTPTPNPTSPFTYSLLSANQVTDDEHFRYRLHTRVLFYYDR